MKNYACIVWILIILGILLLPLSTGYAEEGKEGQEDDKLVKVSEGEKVSEAEKEGKGDKGNVTASLDSVAKTLDVELRQVGKGEAKLGVMELGEYGEQARKLELGKMVQAELQTKLADLGWTMVERARLRDIIKEVELAQLGVINDEKAAELAGLVGADILIVGSISEVGDRYLVNIRAVDRETGTALSASQTEVHSSHLIAMSSEAVVLKTRWGATYRSMVAPGWGQFYNGHPVKAGVFIATELGAVAAAIGLHFAGETAYDDYNNMGPEHSQNDRNNKFDEANRLHDVRNYMFIAIAGIWAINVIDAAVSGDYYTRTESGVKEEGSGGGQFAPVLLGTPDKPAPGIQVMLSY